MKRWSKVLGALRGRAAVGYRPHLEQVRDAIRSEGGWVGSASWARKARLEPVAGESTA